jgi:hypothetical protein
MTPVLKSACGAFALAATAVSSVAALAQTNGPPSAPNQERRVPPQHFGPNGQMNTPGESPGESHGVMPPPKTGDDNVIQPKNQSQAPTPTIRPPGTPGGNPNVQPR